MCVCVRILFRNHSFRVCFLVSSAGLNLTNEKFFLFVWFPLLLCPSFHLCPTAAASLSVRLFPLKVTGLGFMAGICSESLSSVYLRIRRFELRMVVGALCNQTPSVTADSHMLIYGRKATRCHLCRQSDTTMALGYVSGPRGGSKLFS